MPEAPHGSAGKRRPLPELLVRGDGPGPGAYAELHARSCFSFLQGASHPDELVARAAGLGLRALAVTDEASLAGVVRAHVAAKAAGLPLIIGTELRLDDVPGARLLLHARDRTGYGRLARLITVGRRRADREAGASSAFYSLALGDVLDHAEGHAGWLATLVPDRPARRADLIETPRPRLPSCTAPSATRRFAEVGAAGGSTDPLPALRRLADRFGPLCSVGAALLRGPDDAARLAATRDLARAAGVPLVALGDVAMHDPARRRLLAVLTCIREGTTLGEGGLALPANGERALRPPAELARRWAAAPGAVARAAELAGLCGFSLDELRYEYPEEIVPAGETATSWLRALTMRGAAARYPGGLPPAVRAQLEHELALVAELGYEAYFLTVEDLVRFARARGILCQGRGSAANSAVCFCLGITSVDPARAEVLFERFVSRSRREPPDIDVDFEHERREEVIQYVYSKYGRDRAAIAAEVITYRGRSAVREVGKALGLSLDQVDRLAATLDWGGDLPDPAEGKARLREAGVDPQSLAARLLGELVREVQGLPRHLSQHVGGFVISRGPLVELVPVRNAAMPDRTFIEWDKDDLDALGLLKVDCLALGMLTAIQRTLAHVAPERGNGTISLAEIPAEDPAVYEMLCHADSVGVFQVESRAQMSMLPRLRPRCFYDLVVEVSIVRPGPIQGGIVHPYLRRRRGVERVASICPEADRVLAKTLGVPVFQEQAMRLAIEAAGFTPDEADALRKAMGAWRKTGTIDGFRERFVRGVEAKGVAPEVASELFERIRGFGEYGFPESHAASFALLVYASAWLKRHHPAAFTAGLLDAQPMGFYAPAQLVADARAHGVTVLAPCVQASGWDSRLERTGAPAEDRSAPGAPPATWGAGGPALRLGLRQVRGLAELHGRAVERARRAGPFTSPADLARRAGLSRDALARLAEADALLCFGLHRREALFDALARGGAEPPLFAHVDEPPVVAGLPPEPPLERVLDDYASIGLSLQAHPCALVRDALTALGARTTAELRDARHGAKLAVAGLVIGRQRPQTAKGIYFFTLEDEAGVANLIIRPDVFEAHRRLARGAKALLARGDVEREGEVVHLLVRRLADAGPAFSGRIVQQRSRDFR